MEEIQGTGFISAEQLEWTDFKDAYKQVCQGLSYLKEDAIRLEGCISENAEFDVNEAAIIFLKDFCTIMFDLNTKFLHPADFEKMFRVEIFRSKFASSVGMIKELKIIDIVEKLSNKKEEGYDPSYDKELVKTAKGYLIQAEIYLSQFK